MTIENTLPTDQDDNLSDLPTNPRSQEPKSNPATELTREIGGPTGPDPTRYGDWEKNGRCIDF